MLGCRGPGIEAFGTDGRDLERVGFAFARMGPWITAGMVVERKPCVRPGVHVNTQGGSRLCSCQQYFQIENGRGETFY